MFYSVKVDLHCHTTASDGSLEPQALVQAARDNGVELLAITDHDTIAGYLCARDYLASTDPIAGTGLQLLSGVEFSSTWLGLQIHVVGLGFNADSANLQAAIAQQQQVRAERAAAIARQLEKKLGIGGVLAAVQEIAGEQAPARPHFAEFLVREGIAKDTGKAFSQYLSDNKLGAISKPWPALALVTSWICEAGGVAVLAHPESYQLTRSRLLRLATEFAVAGGRGMEMAGKQHTPQVIDTVATICRQTGLLASTGSDFHGIGQAWRALGSCASIPAGLLPVWELPELAPGRDYQVVSA